MTILVNYNYHIFQAMDGDYGVNGQLLYSIASLSPTSSYNLYVICMFSLFSPYPFFFKMAVVARCHGHQSNATKQNNILQGNSCTELHKT
jgi:hypothetical protein